MLIYFFTISIYSYNTYFRINNINYFIGEVNLNGGLDKSDSFPSAGTLFIGMFQLYLIN